MAIFLKALLLLSYFFLPDEPEVKDIMPLKMGNTWVYRNYTWNEKNESTERYNDSISFTHDTLISGERWFISTDHNISSYYTIRTSGMWGFTSVETIPYLMTKYPCHIGDVFQGKDSFETRIILSEHETIAVTAGVFTCIKMYVKSPLFEQESYWHPGVGLIRSIMYRKNAEGVLYKSLEYELVRYTVH